MAEQLTIHTVNGVNIETLQETVDSLKHDSELAQCRFRTHNRWINGSHNRNRNTGFYGAKQEFSHSPEFVLDADEPAIMAGKGQAAGPLEHLLNALASCLTTSMVYHAALRGIYIEELEAEVEGDLDLQGFFGLSPNVRKGYKNIRVTFKVKTDAENVERLKELTEYSPVFDVVSNGTDVEVQVKSK
jgi:uncharacterized OsmC-like protein